MLMDVMIRRPGRMRCSRACLATQLPTALAIVVGLCRADRELRLQLEKVLLAQAADVPQLLALLEGSVLLPVLDDAGGGFGADAGQRFEVRGGGGVDVDGRGRRRFRGRRARLAR